ncbi:MAG TPA: class I SAM-dependent methyltransferase [Thermoleophilaceae bacterium]|jgi:demethylmenaquinone methyltransferase/2-methoxy-6-polyprenyl-1,4-benzoquinol methylase
MTSFAEYYDRRAPEYDDWYLGAGLFADRDRPGWREDVDALCGAVAALPPARVLDVACGTGFLTRHVRGEVTGLDQSERMLAEAAARLPHARLVKGDAFGLPFEDGEFERLMTGHFYGHLDPGERERFVAEARRVAGELLVIDSALHDGVEPEEWQERTLNDGSRHLVYKRYFTAPGLVAELGGAGDVVHDGPWFVAVRSPLT